MLKGVVVILCLINIFLCGYLWIIKKQIKSMTQQLHRRIAKHTREQIAITLIDKNLNELSKRINQCLMAEENLRLNGVIEEKRFKEMIANISHDLRTPLTAIRGYQEMILKEPLSEKQKKRMLIAQKHSVELGQLINHFFEYSYLVNAQPQPKPEQVNITNLIAENLADFVNDFENQNMKISFEQNESIHASTDIEMVTRIIQNLIRNCLTHSDGDVSVSIKSEKDNFVITFQNPINDVKNIDINSLFERFYKADQARTNATTGLGLAIVKLLTDTLKGTVSASLDQNCLIMKVIIPLSYESACRIS